MAAQGLKRDELSYELKLRHVEGVDHMTLSLLRNFLSPLLLEKVDLEFPEVELDVSSEFTICENKFSEMKVLVSQFFDSSESMAFTIINNRLLHLLNRTRRLVSRASVESKKQIDDLVAQILELDEEFNTRCEDFSSTPMSPVAMSSNANVSSNAGVNDLQPIVNGDNRSHYIPVFKWNVSFDGSQPVNEFLQRIEELRTARQCPKETLFNSAVDIFSGNALEWFRMIQSQGVRDWDSLVAALRDHFLPNDSDFEITQKIFSRTQQPDEKIILFLASLHGLVQQLSTPLADDQLIPIIKRNILPLYGPYLVTGHFDSVKELSNFLVLMEPTILRNKAALTCSRSHVTTKRRSSPARTANKSVVVSTNAVTNEQKCWNCLQSGHLYAQCSVARNRFCYRCGNRDHIANSCSVQRVVKSENFNAGN